MPFLTTQDPRAQIKGSRDPLGLVPLWYGPARRLVGNLTTATATLRGFTHTLIGRWYGERLVREERIDEADVLGVFLRFEQIAAYVRFAGHGVDDDTRGIERVKRNSHEGKGRVPIGTDRLGRILSDQKVYGLWGLYSVATRVSGLLLDGPIGLTAPARDFVDATYGDRLRRLDDQLLPLVERGGKLSTRRNTKLFAALCEILPKVPTPDERAWYGEWIRDGLHVKDLPPRRQQIVADLIARHTDRSEPIDRAAVERMRDHVPADDDALRKAFQDVLDLEALLVPADLAFDYVQTLEGETPATAARRLRDAWGDHVPHLDATAVENLVSRITHGTNEDLTSAIKDVARAFAVADYEAALRGLLRWNEQVMRGRQAAPWVALDDLGHLEVHYAGRERLLPDGDALATRWHNSYFLNSVAAISRQLDGGV